jgi:hypothetical protein
VSLDLNHYEMGLLKYDIFIGREVDFNGTSSFFPAVSVLPKDIKKILLKQCEKLSKHHNPYLECEFLLRLESYKSKLKNYGHLDTKKIFVFED